MKAIVLYLGITYFLAITLSVVIGVAGGQTIPYLGLGIISMLIPALTVVILSSAINEGPRVNWNLFPGTYFPLALLLIPLVMQAAMLPTTYILEGKIPWQHWLYPAADGLYHTPADKAWGIVSQAGLITHLITNAVIGVIIVSFMALFEEIGWRGWLLPRLSEKLGSVHAVILTSVIWAFWHLPFVFSGILKMNGVSTLTTLVIAPLGTFIVGLTIGWLWLRTKSIWIVSIAHGALNNWGQFAFKYMDDFAVANPAIVLLTGSFALLLTGIFLLRYCLPKHVQ
jgi:membrane protease YdiL (CAAX protease family)